MPHSRLVLVTGASRGIGWALSLKLLDAGSRGVGIERDFSHWSLPRTGFEAVAADLAELDGLPGLLSGIAGDYPELDAVVSNAGAGRFGHLEQFSPPRIRACVDLNLTQHILVARAFLPLLKHRSRADLIFMGSETALSGGIKGAVYSACKSALRGLARSLRQECAAAGVSALSIRGWCGPAFSTGSIFVPARRPKTPLPRRTWPMRLSPYSVHPHGTVVDEINLSPLKKVIRTGSRASHSLAHAQAKG